MIDLETLEEILRSRPQGWWETLVAEIPELRPMSDTPQDSCFHAEGDVAVHTRLAIESCPPDSEPDLLWAALLHDIGKPATTDCSGDRITARGHDRLSAQMSEEILARLGLAPDRIERIVWVIRHHLFHLSWHLEPDAKLSNRQRRFIEHPDFPLLLDLLRVDSLASCGGKGMEAYEQYQKRYLTVLSEQCNN